MFDIIKEKLDNLDCIKMFNTHTKEYVSIIPEYGANVNEIVLIKNGCLYSVIDGNKNMQLFKTRRIFNGAKLFPFPNRIEYGKYSFNHREYSLPINYHDEGNSVHGFVYNKVFQVTDTKITDDSVSLSLEYNYKGDIEGFPFPFEIRIKYQLTKTNGFGCTTNVKSNSSVPFPFGDGWHPFFKIHSVKVDNLYLKFSADEIIITNKNLIPISRKKYKCFNELKKIGNNNYDHCFKLSPESEHSVELFDRSTNVSIALWFDGGENKYNYLQLYTPPDRDAIAIEPMTCNINAFRNKEGLQVLRPNESFLASYGVKLL